MRADEYIKSVELLADHLSPVQRFYAGTFGFIPVVDQYEYNWMVSAHATIQTVYSFEKNKWFCLTSADPILPHGDVVLGIVLMLQYDVERFMANARELSGPPDIVNVIDESAFRFIRPEAAEEDVFSFEDCDACDTETKPEGYHLIEACDYHRGLSHGITAGFYARAGFDQFSKSSKDHVAERVARDTAISISSMKKEIGTELPNLMERLLSKDDVQQEFFVEVLEEVINEHIKDSVND